MTVTRPDPRDHPDWPDLPVPGHLVLLPLVCPPLAAAVGYCGTAQWISVHWSPYGDEVVVADGTVSGTGAWPGWLAFAHHPLGRVLLEPYELGSSDTEARHWVMIDRADGSLSVGIPADVRALVRSQPSELHAATAEMPPAEAAAYALEYVKRRAARATAWAAIRASAARARAAAQVTAWLDARVADINGDAPAGRDGP